MDRNAKVIEWKCVCSSSSHRNLIDSAAKGRPVKSEYIQHTHSRAAFMLYSLCYLQHVVEESNISFVVLLLETEGEMLL